MIRWQIDTSVTTWQRRALRYLAIYLLLALALVTSRYLTRHVRPNLREAQTQETQLLSQKDQLEIAVQVATTPQKVQEWALSQGMEPFAESSKTVKDFGQDSGRGLAAPPVSPSSSAPLEVRTQWK